MMCGALSSYSFLLQRRAWAALPPGCAVFRLVVETPARNARRCAQNAGSLRLGGVGFAPAACSDCRACITPTCFVFCVLCFCLLVFSTTADDLFALALRLPRLLVLSPIAVCYVRLLQTRGERREPRGLLPKKRRELQEGTPRLLPVCRSPEQVFFFLCFR